VSSPENTSSSGSSPRKDSVSSDDKSPATSSVTKDASQILKRGVSFDARRERGPSIFEQIELETAILLSSRSPDSAPVGVYYISSFFSSPILTR